MHLWGEMMIRLFSTFVLALFCSFSLVSAQDGAQDVDQKIEKLKKELIAEINKVKESTSAATPYTEADVRQMCGDYPAGHWSANTRKTNDWGILRGAHDPGGKRGVYRVCHWNSSGIVHVRLDKDDNGQTFQLYPRSCVDVAEAIHIVALPQDKDRLVFGFYCRIE